MGREARIASPDAERRLIEMWSAGEVASEIAKKLGVCRNTVTRTAARLGLEPRGLEWASVKGAKTRREQHKRKIEAMHLTVVKISGLRGEGKTIKEISLSLGVSKAAVNKAVRREKIPRGRGRRMRKDRSELIRLWRNGVKEDEIIQKCGITTRSALSNLVYTLGLPLRGAEPPEELFQGDEQLPPK
jgi:hypothetical protein